MVSPEGAVDQPDPELGVKSHGVTMPELHAKRCGTHVNYRMASLLAASRSLKGEFARKDRPRVTCSGVMPEELADVKIHVIKT